MNIHKLQAEKLWSSSTNTDVIQLNCEYTRITSWKVVKQFYKYWRNTSKLWSPVDTHEFQVVKQIYKYWRNTSKTWSSMKAHELLTEKILKVVMQRITKCHQNYIKLDQTFNYTLLKYKKRTQKWSSRKKVFFYLNPYKYYLSGEQSHQTEFVDISNEITGLYIHPYDTPLSIEL